MTMKPQKPKVRQVQELRRSSAAQPHRNKARYTRKTKHKDRQYV